MTEQTPMEKHLTNFIEDMMQQKLRLSESQSLYQEALVKIKERIVDETQLLETASNESRPFYEERKADDEAHQKRIESILEEQHEIIEKITLDVYHHLLELSHLEIKRAGFITHIVTVNDQTDYNKETKVIKFHRKDGHAEIPIATTLRKWNDASQIRILPKVNQ